MDVPETPERKKKRHDYWVYFTLIGLRNQDFTVAEVRAYTARWTDDTIKAELAERFHEYLPQVRDAQDEAARIFEEEVNNARTKEQTTTNLYDQEASDHTTTTGA